MTRKKNPSSASIFSARLLFAALFGMFAGFVAATLDTWQAASSLSGKLEVLWVFVQATGSLGLFGALMGFAAAFFTALGKKLVGAFNLSEDSGAAALLTLIASPGLIYIAVRLFQGGAASRLPGRFALVSAAGVVLLALFFIGARTCLALIGRSDDKSFSRATVLVIAFGLVLLGLGCRWCDAHLYKRLYLYLHSALGLATLGAFALAARIAFQKKPGKTGARIGALLMAATLCLFAAARISGVRSQAAKTAAWNRTATLAGLLRATAVADEKPLASSAADKVQRLQRERAARILTAVKGDWPVLPGAHFLFVTVDALRADRMGVYGNTRRELSPNIDSWARENGVVFERAYCTAPHSSYSITSLHTSRFTHEEAMLEEEITHPTLADILKNSGYETTAFYTQGIFFTEGDKVGHYRRSKFGFENVTNGAFEPSELTDRAIAAIDAAAEKDKPTFTWVHYFNIHEPYLSVHFGTSPADRYDGEILKTDPEVVRLISHARDVLSENLIVVFASDHGEEFNDHGGQYHGSSLYEEQIRVPLVISLPGARPRRVKSPVSIAGIAPTALRLLGIEPPAAMLGQDLRPAIFGGDDRHVGQPVFSSVMRHHAVIRWPWKLIAEPSLQLYELYNLKSDPNERANLVDFKPSLADELLQEIQVWLDGLARTEDEAQTALNMGHMRDIRAIPGLKRLALNTGAPPRDRIEAVQLLSKMGDHSTVPTLKPLMNDTNEQVAIAAALALGVLGDLSGQDLVRDALFDKDPSVRDSAALVLGKAGDVFAAPGLVEALGRDDVRTREEAIRALGLLGALDTVEPLLDALAEERTRYLVVLALGMIGDPRAYDAIMDVLEKDRHADVRGYAVVALGWLERAEAIPRLVRLLKEEPEIKWTAESLVRLGGVGKTPLFGADASEGSGTLISGFGRCTAKPKKIQSEFLSRTTCKTTGPAAVLKFYADAPEGAEIVIRARHLNRDKGVFIPLAIQVDGVEAGEVELLGDFQELRLNTPAGLWPPADHRVLLQLKKNAAFEIDHFLVLADDK